MPGMEPGVEARVREAVAVLEAAGATVEEVSLPHTDYGLATYYIVAPAEASANLARYDGIRYGPAVRDGDILANYLATRGRGFGAEVKRRIMLGTYALSAGYYDAFYLKAQKVRTLIKPTSTRSGRRASTRSSPRPRRRSRSASARRWPTRWRCTSTTRAPCRSTWPGCRGSRSRAACPRACRSGCSSSGRRGASRRCSRLARAYEGITAEAEWRRLEPTALAARTTRGPSPAERAARPRRALESPPAATPGGRPVRTTGQEAARLVATGLGGTDLMRSAGRRRSGPGVVGRSSAR